MRKAAGGQRGVRKVRTAGGSRYYGLPIGSPITADDIARAKARNGGADAPAPEKAAQQPTTGGKPAAPAKKGLLNRKKAAPAAAAGAPAAPSGPTNTVTVGTQAYNIPANVTLHPSPTGGPNVYAISPDESVRVLTPNGIVDLDDTTSDMIVGELFGGADQQPGGDDEPTTEYNPNAPAADGDAPAPEKKPLPGSPKRPGTSKKRSQPTGDADTDVFTRWDEEAAIDSVSDIAVGDVVRFLDEGHVSHLKRLDADTFAQDDFAWGGGQTYDAAYVRNEIKSGNISTPRHGEAEPSFAKVEGKRVADLMERAQGGDEDAQRDLEAMGELRYDSKSGSLVPASKAPEKPAEKATSKPSPGSPGDDEPTSTPTSPKKTPTAAQKDWDMRADSDFGVEGERPDTGYGDDMSDEDLEIYSKPTGENDRRTPSQRKFDHAADSDFGIDGRQQRPDEGLGDQAPEEPKAPAKKAAPVRDAGPADKTKPVGNGNWDPTSMGRSTPPPNGEEIEALKASPYTSKHLDENGNFTPERIAVHDAIIEAFLEGLESQQNPVQYMNGGGPASGKGTMTKGKNAELTNYPAARGVNDITGEIEAMDTPPGALLIDPDAIKMQLPEVKEARARQAENAGTDDDKQWAGSSHEESSQLAKRLHRAALERGYNVIYDGTGNGSPNSVRSKVRAAKALGYRVEANYLYLEPQEGIGRAKLRADRANRIVPASQITGTYAKLPAIFDELKEEGLFDKVNLFDNNVPYGQPANHIGTGDGTTFEILDPEAYQKYMSSRERTDVTRFQSSAEQVIGQYSAMEPEITSFMEDMAAEYDVELVGLNHRLKSPESLSRKMSNVASKAGLTPEEAQAHVRDALRYTMRIPDETYLETVQRVLEEFRRHNYEIDAKNSWAPNSEYMGINVTVTDPETDKSFEVQFHTPESLRVKHDENHPLYVVNRAAPKGSKEYKERQAAMIVNSSKIPVPEGVYDLEL